MQFLICKKNDCYQYEWMSEASGINRLRASQPLTFPLIWWLPLLALGLANCDLRPRQKNHFNWGGGALLSMPKQSMAKIFKKKFSKSNTTKKQVPRTICNANQWVLANRTPSKYTRKAFEEIVTALMHKKTLEIIKVSTVNTRRRYWIRIKKEISLPFNFSGIRIIM